MSTDALHDVGAIRIDRAGREVRRDCVAEETPVAMVYNGRSLAVMMATPADLKDFALGFSLSEGVVASPGEWDLHDIHHGGDGIEIRMRIPDVRFQALDARQRNLPGRAGCGLCGADALATAIRPVRRVPPATPVTVAALREAFAALRKGQVLNDRCHGLHAAGFAHAEGMIVREDVGRHNALDKVIGARARAGVDAGFLLITSRASYEVVHKAAEAGITVLAAISAPTALAIRLAEQAGLTLIAFAREEGLSVYAHAAGLEVGSE
ncbi:MAG TPA: formate dehydrogenase accessory sulfurtransferase FdhD [Xanthomonadaceae bacterium]|nr:formate dehydrogenase accessory sulfurtransferase FdhD [Xanthomonadaceae bacterium]